MVSTLVVFLLGFQVNSHSGDVGLFAKAQWFMHEFGTNACSAANQDKHLKNVLAKSYAKDRDLTLDELNGLIAHESFQKFAGDDSRLSEAEIAKALELATPASRMQLLPDLCHHAAFLTTSFDMIDDEHLKSIDQLSDWIAEQSTPNRTLHVLTTCTGNSRRSILSAAMGNLAAAYYGLDNVRFHSGGTVPSAFNRRTIATLKDIGFQIEPTGAEAKRGDPMTPNPIYQVRWGTGLETSEYSKLYTDKSNPRTDFAAILVCSEADQECPTVPGASLRVSMTFIDPKYYDDGVFEKRKYAERRDDIGRSYLAVMASARHKLKAIKWKRQ